jgi:cobalamin synthase
LSSPSSSQRTERSSNRMASLCSIPWCSAPAGGVSLGRRAAWWVAGCVWSVAGGVMVAWLAVASLGVCERRCGGVAGNCLGSAHQRRHGGVSSCPGLSPMRVKTHPLWG